MKKLLAVAFFGLALHTVHAQKTGIGYTQKNLETGVGKGGNLRIIETGCDCRKFERTADNRCINCLNRQIGVPLGLTAQPNKPTLPTLAKKTN